MRRRDFVSVLLSLPLARDVARALVAGPRGPQLWLATRGKARVFIFGFGEAKDRAWLTPSVRQAFEESVQLWLETGGANSAPNDDAAAREASAARIERLSHEPDRTLFEALEPPVRERTLAYIEELEIPSASIETLRPWRAYSAIVGAFFAKRKLPYEPVFVDAVLAGKATTAGKRIGYEMPTRESFATFMAAMSDTAQSQYIEWLLDFLDDEKRGLNDDAATYGWVTGNPPTRTLDRMRTKAPELYRVMQPQRNAWWGRKIQTLLATDGSYFVAVGQLHVLGPDGIPRQLERLGITVALVS